MKLELTPIHAKWYNKAKEMVTGRNAIAISPVKVSQKSRACKT